MYHRFFFDSVLLHMRGPKPRSTAKEIAVETVISVEVRKKQPSGKGE